MARINEINKKQHIKTDIYDFYGHKKRDAKQKTCSCEACKQAKSIYLTPYGVGRRK